MSNIRQVKVKNTRAVCQYHYVSIYVSITLLGSNTVCISAVCIYNVYYQKSNRNPDELTFHWWAALTETASSSNTLIRKTVRRSKCYLVVNVGLTQVTPHGEIREAQHHRMFRHGAVSHHVLVNVTTTEHLRQEGEQVRHTRIINRWDTLLHHQQVRQVTW